MKKVISASLILVLSLLSLYSIADIIESIVLVSRYENFNADSTGIIAGKIIFAALCIAIIFILYKRVHKRPFN
ncbi:MULTISPECIES: hypothetical protein [Pantoea]|uniref:Uncharacterized protein n=1 Tax=Pantoea rwandensis TaxID=1076550 RepID=A0ABM5RIV0_9GAMM|nr:MULTISPECIES: hypothetical protein [Pantoea]AIR85795.1 hypothetical protein LH22_10085 [Pantoea rwandensis]MBK0124848.1 hypothetical protein [Pantoea sp. S61]